MTNEEGLDLKQLLGPICILQITLATPGVWGDEEETFPSDVLRDSTVVFLLF